MMALSCIVQALVLLVSANGGPVLASRLSGKRWAWPVDNGITLGDGQRLFGNDKTWRGLVSALGLTGLAALVLGMELLTGVGFGLLAMVGDLSASFIKRRLAKAPGSRVRGLDTVPESLLPILFLNEALALKLSDIVALVLIFFLIEEFLSPVLYRLHIRKRPY